MVLVQEQHLKEVRSWEEYLSRGMEARESKDQSEWLLGDLAQGIDKDYGEDAIGKYAYAIGMVKKTLVGYRTVAGVYSVEIREKYRKLSFSHFKTCASLEKPEAWLRKADDREWSVEKMSHEITEAYGDLKAPNLEDKPPRVFRCPECNNWRLEGISYYEICKGHWVIEKGEMTNI